TSVKVEAVYQKVSREASDHARRLGRDDAECVAAAPGAGPCESSSGPLFEDITDTAYGVDQRMPEGLVDLRAQPADVHIDDVGPAVEVHVPDLLRDQRPGEDVAHVAGEEREQEELLGSEIQTLSGAGGAVTHQVDLEIGDLELLLMPSRSATQDRPHAGQELGKSEGLYERV